MLILRDVLAALPRVDVRCSMPPTPGLYVGRDAVVIDWGEDGFDRLRGPVGLRHRAGDGLLVGAECTARRFRLARDRPFRGRPPTVT
ncbi:hypothetical protein ACFYTC_15530 [Actinomadura nitritigenes]|uniref:hypothetical protein n=1 Tax=Actinomadura nitritigenes TaxID=134602 RepID=UPI00368E91A8